MEEAGVGEAEGGFRGAVLGEMVVIGRGRGKSGGQRDEALEE
jgi:hypothetical protein